MSLDSNAKILVVDDTSAMRKVIVCMLKKLASYTVDEAEDGEPAWNKIQNEGYDLIISDWSMPVMNGIELVKNLRTSEQFQNLPFILTVSEKEQSNINLAMNAGINDFLVKPFDLNSLQKKITSL